MPLYVGLGARMSLNSSLDLELGLVQSSSSNILCSHDFNLDTQDTRIPHSSIVFFSNSEFHVRIGSFHGVGKFCGSRLPPVLGLRI